MSKIKQHLKDHKEAYIVGGVCLARSLMNFLSLRTKNPDSAFPSYPQREIEMVAEKTEKEWERLMPITHKAFTANRRVAP